MFLFACWKKKKEKTMTGKIAGFIRSLFGRPTKPSIGDGMQERIVEIDARLKELGEKFERHVDAHGGVTVDMDGLLERIQMLEDKVEELKEEVKGERK